MLFLYEPVEPDHISSILQVTSNVQSIQFQASTESVIIQEDHKIFVLHKICIVHNW